MGRGLPRCARRVVEGGRRSQARGRSFSQKNRKRRPVPATADAASVEDVARLSFAEIDVKLGHAIRHFEQVFSRVGAEERLEQRAAGAGEHRLARRIILEEDDARTVLASAAGALNVGLRRFRLGERDDEGRA